MKVSIISPILNCKLELISLINSLIALNRKIEIEWVVIDGGSIDGSKELVESYAGFLKIKLLQNNNGFYESLNMGIENCTGSFYICAGADDFFYPDSIMKAVESIDLNKIPDFIAGGFLLRESRRKRYPGRYTARLRGIAGILSNHSIALMIRTNLHKEFGFYDVSYKYLADQRFCLQVALKSKNIRRLNLIFGEVGENGFSTNKKGQLKKEWERIKLEIF